MKIKVFVLLLLFCASANAAPVWSGYTEVTNLYPTVEGLMFNTLYKNPQLSSCDDGGRFVLNMAVPDYNTQVSVLIAAFMAGKRVNLYIEDQPARCAAVIIRFKVAR
ncbi:hypothetical protein [Rheinheimera sp. NSM]|uniref:hypothetical protein n=1 Tax=Rheinheimera sp. NSM TaxID=3457884 RepID=UPI0040361B99